MLKAKIYGNNCWELGSLDPGSLTQIMREGIMQYLDPVPFAQMKRKQENGREWLYQLCDGMIV